MKTNKSGYVTGVIAAIIVLLWIGIVKFTPSEAKAIQPLVEHSWLMSWLYQLFSIQTTSTIIGIFEIVTALFLTASFWSKKAGKIAGLLTIVIFATTLSFLISTPGIWKMMDGVPVTDFFIVKDLAFLAVGLQVLAQSEAENNS
ncbi:putative membrane protein YkgB [Pedobacter cryoconitis]|uniref:Putative membrane protein YkgB n=1 Tax=Pedobacter cryoconitis TaxID=188932 RepID=A0A7W8ZMC9_9SPHI|nr:DUF417 family protein [Pedobacter cryoconitis]MBB5636495.1 putative membrane protein YkgB [Pedobacter cryoconitis]